MKKVLVVLSDLGKFVLLSNDSKEILTREDGIKSDAINFGTSNHVYINENTNEVFHHKFNDVPKELLQNEYIYSTSKEEDDKYLSEEYTFETYKKENIQYKGYGYFIDAVMRVPVLSIIIGVVTSILSVFMIYNILKGNAEETKKNFLTSYFLLAIYVAGISFIAFREAKKEDPELKFFDFVKTYAKAYFIG